MSSSLVFSAIEYTGLPDMVSAFLIPAPPSAWYFVFLYFLFVAYAISRLYLGNILTKTFQGSIRYNTAIKIIEDNSQLQKQIDQVLFGFYFLSVALFFVILEMRTGLSPYGFTGVKLLLFGILLLILILTSRTIILTVIGKIFHQKNIFYEYLNHGYFYNQLAGIILLPMNFLLVYTTGYMNDVMFYLTVILLLVILMAKIIRGIIFASKHGILNFYLFLYLCALEIVPLLLLYKWIFSVAIK